MQDVHAQLESAGLIVDGVLDTSGRLVRCRVDGDTHSKKSGWYVLHEFRLRNGGTVLTGRYGNWKRYGDESLKVEFDLPELSDQERQEFAQRQAEQRMQAEQEKQVRAADAAERAGRIFSKLPEGGASDYLKRKKVRAFGLRFSRGSIVVPVRNIDGDLVGLQFIDADGGKKFLTGTPKRGAMHILGEIDPRATVVIAEGYATAASVHQAVKWPVVVAFDAGNILPVSQAIRGRYPDVDMIIAADNDYMTAGNPGITKAREAALSVNARICWPEFFRAAA